jgi:hypothetical protein
MRYTIRFFGIIVFTIDAQEYDDELVVEAGSAHNFERDYYPLSPTAHHEWEWEDKKKGFGFR